MDKVKKLQSAKEFGKGLKLNLLSTEFVRTTEKMEWQCENGHIFNKSLSGVKDSFKRYGTNGCSQCSGNEKLNIKLIKKECAKHGVVVLSEKYKNAREKIEFECEHGHQYKSLWSNVKKSFASSNNGCNVCEGNNKRRSYQDYLDLGIVLNIKLLDKSEDIRSIHHSVSWRCNNGHIFKGTYRDLTRKDRNVFNGCRKCVNKRNTSSDKYIKDIGSMAGLTLLGEYVNGKTPVLWRCEQGHEQTITLTSIKRALKSGNNGCMECFRQFHLLHDEYGEGVSFIGRNELNFFKPVIESIFNKYTINPQFLVPNSTKGRPFILDFYIPDLKLAIEYDEYNHKLGSNPEKDRLRQEYIEGKLGCTFYRVDDTEFMSDGRINIIEEMKTLCNRV